MTTQSMNLLEKMRSIPRERGLDPQAVERLARVQPGDAIVCTGGVLWVTQEGDPEDYLLQKGGVFIASRLGAVVVQALGKAAYRLSTNYTTYDRRNKWPISFPG